MITIDVEAKRLSQVAFSLDKMVDRYQTTNGYYSFPSPSFYTMNKNLFYLLRNSVKKDFESKYKMRPDYLSFDEYGTTILYGLLMYVNGILCIEDFDLNEIIIPSMQSIITISRDKFPDKSNNDLETITI